MDDRKDFRGRPNSMVSGTGPHIEVALLTGGSDRPYVFGLTKELLSKGTTVDLIGSDELDFAEFRKNPAVNFLNLRGSQREDVGFLQKTFRISTYYIKLILYAATAKPNIFHVLWNNRFEHFDRTLLMLYYRMLGKRILLTVHNVNTAKRDSIDTPLNRLTLKIQYRLASHIFAHTQKMQLELIEEFGVPRAQVTVIPFGINNAVPNTSLTPSAAKQRLGVGKDEKTLLFFGRVTPYKGLEYLIAAFRQILSRHSDYRLIIAGRVDRCQEYWKPIREGILKLVESGRILLRDEFIPDEETEVYFKAADALVLPYKNIYQSGVLFLGHSFGLPVLAADVGSLKDDIVEGQTGFTFKPEDPADLARAIERYFASELYADLNSRRPQIRDYAEQRHSWDVVGQITTNRYAELLKMSLPEKVSSHSATGSLDVNAPS
jgi:glycosyltransferase involved in cell wall biosynthesis